MTNKEAIQKASWAYIAGAGKAGKGYAIKPSDGSGDFTFSRPDGVNQTGVKNAIDPSGRLVSYPANVPAVNYQLNPNLLLHTEEFNATVWSVFGSEVTRIADQAIAPDGTMTADEIVLNSGFTRMGQTISGLTENTTYTLSWWVKNIDVTSIFMQIPSTSASSNFNYSGLINTQSWTRITRTFTTNAGVTSITPQMTRDGAIDQKMYFWGAQLVEGTEPLKYHRNDSFRRYIPQGLWIEPSATNLLQRSEEFNVSPWSADMGITPNTDIAPDGTQTADTLIGTAGATQAAVQSTTILASTTYTTSVFVKKTTGSLTNYPGLSVSLGGGAEFAFLILNTTAGTANFGPVTGLTVSYRSKSYGNYWRFELTFLGTQTNCAVLLQPAISINGTTITSDAAGSTVFWGAQLEAGSVETSYIKTEGSTVTRPADVATITDASDLIGQTEGTILVECDLRQFNGGFRRLFTIRSGALPTESSTILLDNLSAIIAIRGQVIPLTSATYPAGRQKYGIKYKSGDIKVYRNGELIGSSTATLPQTVTLNTFSLGYDNAGSGQEWLNDFISIPIILKQALSDTEVQNWTTL